MPNYCDNNLYIAGTEDDIVKFLQAICTADNFENAEPDDYSILRKLLPTPEELDNTTTDWSPDPEAQAENKRKNAENIAKYGYENWYDWNVAHWGTKWADGETTMGIRSDGYVSFSFETPWCSPEIGIEKISEMFPTLEFVLTYMEQGIGFVGAHAYKNGSLAESFSEKITTPEYQNEDYETMLEVIEEAYFDAMLECEVHVMLVAGFNHAKV